VGTPYRDTVATDSHFQFRNIPVGNYSLEILASFPDTTRSIHSVLLYQVSAVHPLRTYALAADAQVAVSDSTFYLSHSPGTAPTDTIRLEQDSVEHTITMINDHYRIYYTVTNNP
jgi:hypothetical protein